MKNRVSFFSLCFFGLITCYTSGLHAQGCDLSVDAGPDMFTCDLKKPVQLNASITFNFAPSKIIWTPTTGMDDPSKLNPIINRPPGRYKYKLSAESMGTNLIVNGDFESGPVGFTTDFNLVQPSRTMKPQEYGIGAYPTAYDSVWPNCLGYGNFFIARSPARAGAVVWSQTVPTDPQSLYLFKYKGERFLKTGPGGNGGPVKLQVEADGIIVATVNYLPRCLWTEYSVCFAAKSANTTMTIREISGNSSGFGIDDITMVEKCMAEDEVEIEIVDLHSKIDVSPMPKCSSQEFFLNGSSTLNNPNVKFIWSTDVGKIIQNYGKNILAKGSGTYKLMVVYDNGFAHCEDESEKLIDVDQGIDGVLDIVGHPNCQRDSFTLNGAALNSTGSCSYIWGPANKILSGQGTKTAKANSPGVYTLKIIDNSTKCEFNTQEEVKGDSTLPTVSIAGDSLINCLKNTVTLESFPKDTSHFELTWITPDQQHFKNQFNLNVEIPGQVTLIVKDLNSKCQDSALWNINEDKSLPMIDLGKDLVLDCRNTEFNLVASQQLQSGNFIYYWNLPDGTTKIDSQLRDKFISEPGKVILKVLNYTNHCETSDSIFVTDIRSTPKILIETPDELTCNQLKVNIHATITSNNQVIHWHTPNGNIISRIDSSSIQVDRPGMYIIEVNDSINQCNSSDSVLIYDERNYPVVNLKNDSIFYCRDKEKTIDASGSLRFPNQIYIWSGNGTITSGQGSDKITVSSTGTYNLTILDTITGCSDSKTVTINPDFNKPLALITAPDTLNCKVSSIQLNAIASSLSGNTLKINWSSPQNNPILNSDSLNPVITIPGIYILNVEDQTNGCLTEASVLVNLDTTHPVSNILAPETLNCKLTSIKLNATASSSNNNPLLFNWNSPQSFPIGNPNTLNPVITKPGNYILKITDQKNGCTTTSTIAVLIDTLTPVIDLGKNQLWNCATVNLNLDLLNNTTGLNYAYQWSSIDGIIIGNSNQKTITAGSPGTYRLSVINQDNFCENFSEVKIVDDRNLPWAISSSNDTLTCVVKSALLKSNGSSTGANIIYVWKDINGNIISNNSNASVNQAGKYILEVTNLTNQCKQSDTIEVPENIRIPVVDAGTTQELNCKKNQATLNAVISSPKNNYSIIWSTKNGNIVSGGNGLQPTINQQGEYVITVTDLSNGCLSTDLVTISKDNNVPSHIDYLVAPAKCADDPGSLFILSVTGGKPDYTYFIDGIKVDIKNPIDIFSGKHIIKIVDDNGCELSDEFTLKDANPVIIGLQPEIIFFPGDLLELKPIYSIPIDSIASFEWTPAEYLDCSNCPYPKIKGLQNETIFTVNIVDKNGCTATATVRIRIDERAIWLPNVFSPNGDGINDSFYPVVKENSYKQIRWMRIYDRWGESVFANNNFQPNDPAHGWNGRFKNEPLNPAVYVWVLEIEWKNGDIERLSGDVTLIK